MNLGSWTTVVPTFQIQIQFNSDRIPFWNLHEPQFHCSTHSPDSNSIQFQNAVFTGNKDCESADFKKYPWTARFWLTSGNHVLFRWIPVELRSEFSLELYLSRSTETGHPNNELDAQLWQAVVLSRILTKHLLKQLICSNTDLSSLSAIQKRSKVFP